MNVPSPVDVLGSLVVEEFGTGGGPGLLLMVRFGAFMVGRMGVLVVIGEVFMLLLVLDLANTKSFLFPCCYSFMRFWMAIVSCLRGKKPNKEAEGMGI